MRKTSLSIIKTRVNGVLFWRVTVPKLGGGRERKTFRERQDAQTFFDTAKIQQENYGTAALSISDGLRVEATECSRKLALHGKSLRDATEFYLAHLNAVTNSRKVTDVISELMATKKADGASDRYIGDLRARLARFSATFGNSMIAAISAKQIGEWLRNLGVAALTRNTFRLRLAALFSFALRNGYVAENPVENVEKAKGHSAEIGILTVAQTAKLMERASEETLPYWAIGAFAGLRSAELERLEWSDVDFESGFIQVRARHAKTASRRLVPMQENLRQWLAPYRDAKGQVCPSSALRKKLDAVRESAGLSKNWPNNALRHSFGSYRLPVLGDANRLALEMGNSAAMVFSHYREIVKPREAEAFWRIAPAVRAENVVELVA
jgi:integrase